ncbi:MAG TPA: nucleoside 2-deoxyribosyltransferase [Methanoregulaceae archaeon]|nr:nucleoside 2-deoxyribosyltransferase [Methanoregulaceae archaeon]
MYVLMSPCIPDPGLRAEGITTGEDRFFFDQARKRCEKFGIDIVTLPCPETLFLGKERKPGTFLERLDSDDFRDILTGLEERVRSIIEERGPPLCIVGVNSSPTCGATSTYYGSTDGSSPKKSGRGVFLAKFPELPIADVKEFARYRVYLAAPLFSEAEKAFNIKIRDILKDHFFDVYLPQEVGDDTNCRSKSEHEEIFRMHREALDQVDLLVAVIDGADADSGTAWEMGYATHRGIPVYAIRTDFRMAGHHELVNLMLEQSSVIIRDIRNLPVILRSPGL